MRMKAIASGSSGNSIYVGTDSTHILVDTGLSRKKVEAGLNELNICGNDINGILITHEHSDHIGGLGVFLRKYPVPVYATGKTISQILGYKYLGKVDESLFRPIVYDESFNIGDITVNPIRIRHDAAEPAAYTFEQNGKKSAIVTDLGCYDDYIVNKLKSLDALFIEANHDVRMLETGPYPYELKKRILGNFGHLSNESCGKLVDTVLHDNIKHIVLSHLSQENNIPELAYQAVKTEIDLSETQYRSNDFHMFVASRYEPSEEINF